MSPFSPALLLASLALLAFPPGNCVPSPRFPFDTVIGDEYEMVISSGQARTGRSAGRGNALSSWDCSQVGAVPSAVRQALGLATFYQKYTHAYGIPVVSSSTALDAALERGCYLVRFMLADRQDLRDAMYDKFSRVAVIAQSERTTQIPEHSYLNSYWDDRARGLGGTLNIPVTTDGEENILCYTFWHDRRYQEDVLLHEFAHAIHLIGMRTLGGTFEERLKAAHAQAKNESLWGSTYAITNFKEYWAEGVQSFFGVNTHAEQANGVHNHVSNRTVLKEYDPRLYALILEVFPCANLIVDRCANQGNIDTQEMQMDCDVEVTSAVTTTMENDTATEGTATMGGTTTAGSAASSPRDGSGFASLPCLLAGILLGSKLGS